MRLEIRRQDGGPHLYKSGGWRRRVSVVNVYHKGNRMGLVKTGGDDARHLTRIFDTLSPLLVPP